MSRLSRETLSAVPPGETTPLPSSRQSCPTPWLPNIALLTLLHCYPTGTLRAIAERCDLKFNGWIHIAQLERVRILS
ncbi:hypothetical protein [Nostoc sp. T09]|uniref:hypothetical protein n=1 Tax=Nostoc sp. T09 TaxID=1932621 RepID=UPI00117DE1C9|nr:hypothetical protein [Nostoc sp. T09]